MERQPSKSGEPPLTPHSGRVNLHHTFTDAHTWLWKTQALALQTGAGAAFEARSEIIEGRPVVRIFRKGQELVRVFDCCWGHVHSCDRRVIDTYCEALDAVFPSREVLDA